MGLAAALFGRRAETPSLRAGPGDWMAYGKRQFFVGQPKAAVKAFTRAVEVNPADPLPLAYRSWAGRASHKSRAVADAARAVELDPGCAEAHMSLSLAHVTEPIRPYGYERAIDAVRRGRNLAPADAYGAVLSIGVHLLFVDAIDGSPPDALSGTGRPLTALHHAADSLLGGRHVAALHAFDHIADCGRGLMSALGLAATHWAMRDIRAAGNYSAAVLEHGALEHRGIRAAVGIIAMGAGR